MTITFSDALAKARASGGAAFLAAQAELDAALLDLDSQIPGVKEKAPARIKAAQGFVAAALAQLVQTETTASDQAGRMGYLDAMALMKTTAAIADVVSKRIAVLIPTPVTPPATTTTTAPDNEQLKVLASILDALAHLSPVPLWQQASSSGAATRR